MMDRRDAGKTPPPAILTMHEGPMRGRVIRYRGATTYELIFALDST